MTLLDICGLINAWDVVGYAIVIASPGIMRFVHTDSFANWVAPVEPFQLCYHNVVGAGAGGGCRAISTARPEKEHAPRIGRIRSESPPDAADGRCSTTRALHPNLRRGRPSSLWPY